MKSSSIPGKVFFICWILSLVNSVGYTQMDTLYINEDYINNSSLYRITKDDLHAATVYENSLDSSQQENNLVKQDNGWFGIWLRIDSSLISKNLALSLNGYGYLDLDLYMDSALINSMPPDTGSSIEYGNLEEHPVFFSFQDTNIHRLDIYYRSNIGTSWELTFDINYPDKIYERKLDSLKWISILVLPIGSTFAVLFLIHMLMFLFYRKDIFNLYFGLFNVGCASFFFTIYGTIVAGIKIEDASYITIIISLSCILACYSIAAFCTNLFIKRKWFLWLIGVLSIILSVLHILLYNHENFVSGYLEIFLAGIAIITSIYVVIVFIYSIIKKAPGSSILGGGILFTIFFIFTTVIIGIINKGDLSTDNLLLGAILFVAGILAIFSIPLSISSFLAWRYASTSRSLQVQLEQVKALSEKTIQQEKEKQYILENQKAELEKEVALRTEEIVREKQKSDDLLLNILPHEIAEELKLAGESKARYYENTSVLFTDFVNFTSVSEKLGVDGVLRELNTNFTAFDKIMEKYGLEKIKTIGDAYLAVCGLPSPDPKHAQNTVKAAIEIIAFIQERMKNSSLTFDIRIGIHSGPLVAGIIGVKKFAYDIWGDTVNTAARIEQNSSPGKINISASTYELVKDEFTCLYRGKISVKGKGEMDMYFVG